MQPRRCSPGRVFGRGLALARMVLGAGGLWSMHAQETNLPVYFLVAPYEVDVRAGFLPPDSFVVPMTTPEHINKARELLGVYPQPIVFTLVAPGADGINRNYGVPGFPGWSWHVTEFTGFGDLIIWEYNATPFLLEEYGLDYYWLSPYVGYVGYGVTRVRAVRHGRLWLSRADRYGQHGP